MEEEVRRKREEAFSTARLLCKIPTIYFIGISGGLAAGSATEGDDIDLFIITKKKTMFISRLLALLLLQVVGKRRKRGEKNAPNKMCLNMWLDTSELQFTPSQQDLYTAREIAQLLPLYDRGGTYQMFLRSNSWIKIFLPHAFLFPFRPRHSMNSNTFMERLMGVFEFPSKLLQLYSIKRHQTTEIVTEHALLFHPRDYRQRILKEYAIKIAKDVKLL